MKRNFTKLISFLALASMLLGLTVAPTEVQAQSLDELERKVQRAEEAKARQQREAEEAKVRQQRAEEAAKARKAQEAREAEARRAQEVAAAKARQEREAKVACAGVARHVMVTGSASGVVKQCVTDLEWTQSDNGTDINWNEAESYCRNKGGGWSLPTVEQLQSLYSKELEGQVCWTDEGKSYKCKVSNRLRLSGPIFWSSEREGGSEGWLVFLSDGERYLLRLGVRYSKRALCVRSS